MGSIKILRIGTRNSPLALWQAQKVALELHKHNYKTQLIPIISQGDKNLSLPIYKLGIIGVFTKDIDIALLNNRIDIGVHSLKDIPTYLPEGIQLSAVLERDYPEDVLVRNPSSLNKKVEDLYIGTGSLRRKCFWKYHYPKASFNDIRGNVQTRLQKLVDEKFDGVFFSLAGLKRMNINVKYEVVKFMIPAPAQGVIACTSLIKNNEILEILSKINHQETASIIKIERDFLQVLEGGCSAPIGAYVLKKEMGYVFNGGIVSLDGSKKISITDEFIDFKDNFGHFFAEKLMSKGARKILDEIKNNL